MLLIALEVQGLHTYFELQEPQTHAGKTKHSSIGESTDVYEETLNMLERHFATTFNEPPAEEEEEQNGQNSGQYLQHRIVPRVKGCDMRAA